MAEVAQTWGETLSRLGEQFWDFMTPLAIPVAEGVVEAFESAIGLPAELADFAMNSIAYQEQQKIDQETHAQAVQHETREPGMHKIGESDEPTRATDLAADGVSQEQAQQMGM